MSFELRRPDHSPGFVLCCPASCQSHRRLTLFPRLDDSHKPHNAVCTALHAPCITSSTDHDHVHIHIHVLSVFSTSPSFWLSLSRPRPHFTRRPPLVQKLEQTPIARTASCTLFPSLHPASHPGLPLTLHLFSLRRRVRSYSSQLTAHSLFLSCCSAGFAAQPLAVSLCAPSCISFLSVFSLTGSSSYLHVIAFPPWLPDLFVVSVTRPTYILWLPSVYCRHPL